MKTKLIVAAISAVSLSACMSNPPKAPSGPVTLTPPTVTKEQVSKIPKWFIRPANPEPGTLTAAGTGISRDLSTSLNKAKLDAQVKLADKLKAEVDSLVRDYKRETNDEFGQSYEQLSRKIIDSVRLAGYTVINQEVQPENGMYRSYIQLRYNMDEAERILQRQSASLTARKVAAAAAKAEQDLDNIKARNRAAEDAEIAALGPKPVNNRPTATVNKVQNNSGIVVRATEASEHSQPLTIGDDAAEEN